MKNSYYPGCTKHCKLLYSITPLLNDSPVALGSSGRKRERARVSPSRGPVFSCAHYFQAPAMQATPLVFSRTFRGREAMTGNTSAVRRLKKYQLTPKNACGGYLRTADVLLACSKRSDSGERCGVKKAPHYLNAWNRLTSFRSSLLYFSEGQKRRPEIRLLFAG